MHRILTNNVLIHVIPLNYVSSHSGFIEDNPSGTMTKDKMMEMYSAVLSGAKAKTFVDQIFARLDLAKNCNFVIDHIERFDSDKSGEIDFKVMVSDFKLKSFSRWVRSTSPLSCNSLTDGSETF